MKIPFLAILFVCFSSFAQNLPIEIKIDTLITDNSDSKVRKFTLNYHLKNLTDKQVSFLLNTESIIAFSSGSLNPRPYYKLFEDNNSIDIPGIFSIGNRDQLPLNEVDFSKISQDSINRIVAKYLEKRKAENNKNITNNIQRLEPNEIKNYSVTLFWNKERYRKQDVYEYYLEEKSIHHLEISINLMREELENKLTPEQFKYIMEDKTFIKGWFTSNKVEIQL